MTKNKEKNQSLYQAQRATAKKAGICGTIEAVCLEPHRIRSKMDVSAPRKGFCLDINLFYIFAAIFLPLNYFCTCFFLIAFISQLPPGKGVHGRAKSGSLDSLRREKKLLCQVFVGKTRLDEAWTETLALKIVLGNIP